MVGSHEDAALHARAEGRNVRISLVVGAREEGALLIGPRQAGELLAGLSGVLATGRELDLGGEGQLAPVSVAIDPDLGEPVLTLGGSAPDGGTAALTMPVILLPRLAAELQPFIDEGGEGRWELRYAVKVRARPGGPEGAELDQRLEALSMALAGWAEPHFDRDPQIVLSGKVRLRDVDDLAVMADVLELVGELQIDYGGVEVTLEDSLGLLDVMELSATDLSELAWDPDEDDDWDLADDDPELFDDLGDGIAFTHLGPPKPVEARLESEGAGHFALERARVIRRELRVGTGAVLTVDADLVFAGPGLARVVGCDVVVLDAKGAIVAAEPQWIDRALRRITELHLEVPLEPDEVARAAVLELVVDAYQRVEAEIELSQAPSVAQVAEHELESRIEIRGGEARVLGRVTNKSRRWTGRVDVMVDVLDDEGNAIGVGDVGVSALAPGDTGVFVARAPVDLFEDAPEGGEAGAVAARIMISHRGRQQLGRLHLLDAD